MRLTVALLVLLNIMIVLCVHRLPGGERLESRPSSLPRVTLIDTLRAGKGAGLGTIERGTCFRGAGFLSLVGAHKWLRLRELDPSLQTVSRGAPAEREVGSPRVNYPFGFVSSSSYRHENKRRFILESETVKFYRYAITGRRALAQGWKQRSSARGSGKLKGKRCESIAKPGQNP